MFPSYKKVADAWRRFRETGQRQTAAAAISVTARIHRKTSEYCREFEKIWKTCPGGKSTFRQGLQKIEKQCRTLMRDTGGAESGKSHTQVLEQFLQVSDSLEFAVRQVPADTDGNLEKHLVRLWEDCGKFLREELDVRHIPAEGLPFNPNLHYALMKESRPDIGDEIVLEELQRGYFYQNRVFRPTKVKVASKG